jgi:hypothetical protein
MGFVNTLFNVAEIGLELGQLAQLQGIKEQHTATLIGQLSEARQKALIEAAKNELFTIKQFASAAIKIQDKNTKSAAGAIRYSILRLDDYGIRPDIFPELRDKEYCMEVRQLLKENESLLFGKLSTEEEIEVTKITQIALRMPDYNYYVENFPDVQEYRSAQALIKQRKYKRQGGLNAQLDNSCFGSIAMYIMLFGFGVLPLIALTESFGSFLLSAVICWGLVWLLLKNKNKQKKLFDDYQTAKSKISTFSETVNIEYFEQLENEFGSDYESVKNLQQQYNNQINEFFGGIEQTQELLG